MKKILLTCALLFGVGCFTPMWAQMEVSVGVKAEASLTDFKISGLNTTSDMGFGGAVGGFVKIGIGEYFAIQPELLLNYRTSEMKIAGVKNTFRYWGLEIPAYAVGRFPAGNGKFFVGVGPYVGYGLSAKYKTGDINLYKKQEGADKAALSRFDFGAGAILGYEFANGITVNAGYKLGLVDNLKAAKDDATMKSRVLTLGVGFRF